MCDDIKLKDGEVLGIKFQFSVATIDNVTDARKFTLGFVDKFDHLEDGSSGGYDILNHQNPLTGPDFESPPDLHLFVFPLRKDRAYSEQTTDFRSHDDAPERGRNDEFNVTVFEMFGDLACEQMEILGILKNAGALKILRTVEAGGQLKMALEEGLCLTKNVEDLFFGDFRWHEGSVQSWKAKVGKNCRKF